MPFSTFSIFKLSATGNDFLLIDLLDDSRRRQWQSECPGSRAEQVVKLCDRHHALGADGMVYLEPSSRADFRWDFYNSDGGSAEMCGNAARAVSLYIHTQTHKSELKFESQVGVVEAHIHGPQDVEVGLPAFNESEKNLDCEGHPFTLVNAGVPHAVVPRADLSQPEELRAVAYKIKRLPRFAARGVNVTFLRQIHSQQLESLTFERGVEDFTLSCGTGALAAAYSVWDGHSEQAVQVQVPGGQLSVVWRSGKPWLRGPAQVVATMHLASQP
jgi:diaminopimelate epimerase